MENFKPNDRLQQRRGVLGSFFKRRRQVEALEDACQALKLQNALLSEELEKKDMVVQNLCSYLNEVKPGTPAEGQV